MAVNDGPARVFISCGQTKGTDEVQIAEAIRDNLQIMGFEPYIAVLEQSLAGLTQNIYERLRNSEYFLFVDFKRELLHGCTPVVHRGSLFSHQELAIASFLDLHVLAFQENGVKPDDGIIRFLQTNAIAFNDRNTLVDIVTDSIRKCVTEGKWDPTWRNELVLERKQHKPSEAHIGDMSGPLASYFHIDVRNRHRTKLAINCYVYLEKATRLSPSREEFPLRTVEFKWTGAVIPSVGIGPHSERSFDAFFLLNDEPTTVRFNALTDSWEFHKALQGEGEYELAYLVMSENFPPARGTFKLNLSRSLNQTTLV
jgi:hypothetical protein